MEPVASDAHGQHAFNIEALLPQNHASLAFLELLDDNASRNSRVRLR